MKREATPGKISDHFKGLGTVTREMVESRARELAMINGHAHMTQDDWDEAKRELLGAHAYSDGDEEDTVNVITRWDEEPGSTGHHVPNMEPSDEQTLAERLVEEGVNEAEHEQMVEGSRPGRDEEV
jgi:hypothetical protein